MSAVGDTLLYRQIAARITERIEQMQYVPGERLPGVRKLSRQFGVSVGTVIQAQHLLEDQGRIEARPRAGYFVRARAPLPAAPEPSRPSTRPTLVSGQAMALRLVQATHQPGVVSFGAAVPAEGFLPVQAERAALRRVVSRYAERATAYAFPPGVMELRVQIARRMADAGCTVDPDEVIITSGCQEALTLALRAVAVPGDVIAIESPTFYGLLQVIESLGLKALEIPTHPDHGISLEALQVVLERWPVKACVLVPNYSNPLGYCMPLARKHALLALLAGHDVPLIEDDIWGDLGFGHERPPAVLAGDRDGRVLYCSSFSKTLSPGLRVGWIVPGRYREPVSYYKYVSNLATATLPQWVVAELLAQGGYDRHLRRVRGEYAAHVARLSDAVAESFPPGTRLTRPQGGCVLWVELPQAVDSLVLYERAQARQISIAPGPMFSATGKYRPFIRLNAALPWGRPVEQAVVVLGDLAHQLAEGD
ncbi:aminotransferase-like domain-containing protein [Acidihalobacter yilgarnensis]|uniref:aminotransferase-like domain-containing protein n=1 Tax=Acidihalobacter yilgarnensis TaxID=2819280 RepID=UPI000ACBADDF|nr:PLP-dependent aminotransferase family protein [Acidihalobacter yilgarnensis]